MAAGRIKNCCKIRWIMQAGQSCQPYFLRGPGAGGMGNGGGGDSPNCGL